MKSEADAQPQPAASGSDSSTTALPLLAAWALLIVYASLFPFEGWTLPQGLSPLSLLALPWPAWRDRFDEVANLLGYVPLGALATILAYRRGHEPTRAAYLAVAGALALSFGVEVVQALLPTRVPSLKDTAFNAIGSAVGAAATAILLRSGWIEPWQRVRDRWFGRQGSFALALLLLWPAALLVPLPVPLGLGRVWGGLMQFVEEQAAGTPAAERVDAWVAWAQQVSGQLAAPGEVAIVALGLSAPCLLAFVLTPTRRARMVLAAWVLALALLVTTLSTALNFAPDHALAWFTPRVWLGLAIGCAAITACLGLPMRAAAAMAATVLAFQVLLVVRAPADPYFAQSLSTWEQGRFVRFQGVAQWLAWLWPFAAFLWLLPRAVGLRR